MKLFKRSLVTLGIIGFSVAPGILYGFYETPYDLLRGIELDGRARNVSGEFHAHGGGD